MSTPDDHKAKLREAREAKAADERAAEQRRKRGIGLFAGAGVIAVVVVVLLVALGSGGSDGGSKSAPSAKGLLAGVPQQGTVLGKPSAPVTIYEFVDLQCPFCKEYSLNALPGVINKYVKTGKVKINLRVLSFIGNDSQTAGLVAAGAAKQNKLWDFAESFYRDQKQENTGYVTDDFLGTVSKGAGVNLASAQKVAGTPTADSFLSSATDDAKKYKVQSTPAFVAVKDGKATTLDIQDLTTDGFSSKIDPVLKK